MISPGPPPQLPDPVPDPDCATASPKWRWYGSLIIETSAPGETGVVKHVSRAGDVAGQCELKSHVTQYIDHSTDQTTTSSDQCPGGGWTTTYNRRKSVLNMSKVGSNGGLSFVSDADMTDDPLSMSLTALNRFYPYWYEGGSIEKWSWNSCGLDTYEASQHAEYEPLYSGASYLQTYTDVGDNPRDKCPNMRLASVDAVVSSGVCTYTSGSYTWKYTWDFKKQMSAGTAPGAPAIGQASSGALGGAVNATARWNAPSNDGGSPITAYKVQAQKLNASGAVVARVTKSAGAAARSLVVSLTKGRYKFRVAAVNAKGRSAWSANSNIVRAR